MIVHLSTSSFSVRQFNKSWMKSWTVIFVLFAAFILSIENSLRYYGWNITTADTPELWSKHRVKASRLGDNAFIIVGASRSHLAIDLDEVSKETGMQTIQLSIDGASVLPVIENLADDDQITGTVLISISIPSLYVNNPDDRAVDWVEHYQQQYVNKFQSPYQVLNNSISHWLESSLVSLISGASPYQVMSSLLSGNSVAGNYLTMDINRSRSADYTKVKMPDFYFSRVIRQYGQDIFANVDQVSIDQFINKYQQAIDNLKPERNMTTFINSSEVLTKSINKIIQRGGRVFLINMPKDKMINDIIERRYPREFYWEHLVNQHKNAYHFSDYVQLSQFDLPDGSHLDQKDKQSFTQQLLSVLDL